MLLASIALVAARQRRRRRLPARAVIFAPRTQTVIADDGSVRSVQSADFTLTSADFARLWTSTNLENLARTYWQFLSRVTFGLIRVDYTEDGRAIVLLVRRLRLVRFEAPEYDFEAGYGTVRWRIRDGLLVTRPGRGCGSLALDVRPIESTSDDGQVTVRVEVSVANFYPMIAARLSRPVYKATQSLIHEVVTRAFLRSLATLDLAQSKVGRFAGPESS
jgi:hypothetical protein